MEKPVEAYVYARLHQTRGDWIEDLRRARDHQARLAAMEAEREREWRTTLVAGVILGALMFLTRFI